MQPNQVIPFNFVYGKTAVSPSLSSPTIRRAQAADADLIVALHQQLSETSLYQRYLGGRVPSPANIQEMCALGGGNGRCFVALLPGAPTQAVGMGYYVINPALPIAAEVALLVADAYQGQGIGRKLMNRLVADAQKQQIRFLDGYIQGSNRAMIHLLFSSGKLVENHVDYGCVEMRIELIAQQPQLLQ